MQGKNKWKLEVINNCRLYLECFYVGDLIDKQGKIPVKYLNGTGKRRNKNLHMEQYRRPLDPAWSMWKDFMIQNFLAGPYVVNPVLIKYENTNKTTTKIATAQNITTKTQLKRS